MFGHYLSSVSPVSPYLLHDISCSSDNGDRGDSLAMGGGPSRSGLSPAPLHWPRACVCGARIRRVYRWEHDTDAVCGSLRGRRRPAPFRPSLVTLLPPLFQSPPPGRGVANGPSPHSDVLRHRLILLHLTFPGGFLCLPVAFGRCLVANGLCAPCVLVVLHLGALP